MKPLLHAIRSIIRFYSGGFRNMPLWGRQVWIIILIKLFIMFAILKLFLFPDFLRKSYDTDEQRSVYVLEQLTKPTPDHD
jgi:hypothetical protein